MSPILKKARIQTINARDLRAYLLYALGEIVLIIAGILVALSINSAREARADRAMIRNALIAVADDLRSDTTEFGAVIRAWGEREKQFLKILNNEMTDEDWDECQSCPGLVTAYPIVSLEKAGYTLLQSAVAKSGTDSLSARVFLFYTSVPRFLSEMEKNNAEGVMHAMNHWKMNYSWYSDLVMGRPSEAFFHYARTGTEFKNLLAHHHVLVYVNYVRFIGFCLDEMTELLGEIESQINV